MKTFLQQWQKVLRNTPTKNIKYIFVTVKQFVEYDLRRKKLQWSPFFIAAAQGNLEFWKYTMERINYTNWKKGDVTAFHMAARNGCREICELIIDHLEDKNPADYKGMTPFHNASEKGHFDVCKMIIQNIDNKNPAARDGCTPLHLATKHGHLEIVRLIVETGVDKSPLFKGKTPLDFLVRHRSRYSFYKLLSANISQIWPRILADILITLCLFFMFYFFIFILTAFLLMVFFCGPTNKEVAQNCPAFLETLYIVPCIICLLLVAMIWMYLFGCIHNN